MRTTPVRLPHSGLVVPHTGYTVASFRGHETHDGVAYVATLRLNRKIIGRIENEGRGGPDTFYPSTAGNYRQQVRAMEAFAALCTDARGGTPPMEAVLSDLVAEYETTRDIARAARRGNVLMRMMRDHELGDGPMGWPSPGVWTEAPPALAADHDKLRASLLEDPELAPDDLAWWQIWNADTSTWVDVTARPAHLPADMPGAAPPIPADTATAGPDGHQCDAAETLKYVGTYGAPGVGQAWDCTACGRNWARLGDQFYPADLGAHILAPEDCR